MLVCLVSLSSHGGSRITSKTKHVKKSSFLCRPPPRVFIIFELLLTSVQVFSINEQFCCFYENGVESIHTWDQISTCVLGLSESNLPITPPHPQNSPLSTVSLRVSGYSCRLVTHGMSLIIVNEDSLDVSTPSSYPPSPPLLTSACTLCSIWGLFVHVCVHTGGSGEWGG